MTVAAAPTQRPLDVRIKNTFVHVTEGWEATTESLNRARPRSAPPGLRWHQAPCRQDVAAEALVSHGADEEQRLSTGDPSFAAVHRRIAEAQRAIGCIGNACLTRDNNAATIGDETVPSLASWPAARCGGVLGQRLAAAEAFGDGGSEYAPGPSVFGASVARSPSPASAADEEYRSTPLAPRYALEERGTPVCSAGAASPPAASARIASSAIGHMGASCVDDRAAGGDHALGIPGSASGQQEDHNWFDYVGDLVAAADYDSDVGQAPETPAGASLAISPASRYALEDRGTSVGTADAASPSAATARVATKVIGRMGASCVDDHASGEDHAPVDSSSCSGQQEDHNWFDSVGDLMAMADEDSGVEHAPEPLASASLARLMGPPSASDEERCCNASLASPSTRGVVHLGLWRRRRSRPQRVGRHSHFVEWPHGGLACG